VDLNRFFVALIFFSQEGKGLYRYRDGRVYDGKYHKDYKHDSKGKLTWNNGIEFVGSFVKGRRTGYGKMIYPQNNIIYEGEFGKEKRKMLDGLGYVPLRDDNTLTIPLLLDSLNTTTNYSFSSYDYLKTPQKNHSHT